jgi:multiple sugar transport system permease protein
MVTKRLDAESIGNRALLMRAVKRKSLRDRLEREWLPYLFIAPFLLGLVTLQAYPVLDALYHSFTSYDVFNPAIWVGLDNYTSLLQLELTRTALINTVLFVVVAVPGGLVFGLTYALLLNVQTRARQIFRTLAVIPGTIPAAGAAAVWVFIWNPGLGLINSILKALGLPWRQIWISDPYMAKWIFIVMTIQGGIGMLIFLAGLQNMPQELYDAARMDGANLLGQFSNVTLPMLTPYLLYCLLLGLIDAFQYFTFPMLMTGGGPAGGSTFYGQLIYTYAFQYFKMGHAAALSWILFLICVVVVIAVFRSSARWVYYEGGE